MKTITFEIPRIGELLISNFPEHKKSHILALFFKLEKLGFGIYARGQRGRGNQPAFFPTKDCPRVYMLEIERKKEK